MRYSSFGCFILPAMLLVTGSPASGQIRSGLDTGTVIPNFTLPDQHGKDRTWASITGPRGGLLVFDQSVDWCGWCKTHFVELQENQALLESQGLAQAAITFDAQRLLQAYAARKKLTFPVLSDERHVVIERFGILNQTVPPADLHFGVPWPGIFVLDAGGRIISKYFGDRYHGRLTPRTILVRDFGWTPEQMQTQSTPDMTIRYGLSDTVSRPDGHITLIIDVTLRDNAQVVPPGAPDVKPLTWTLKNSEWYESEAAEFPATPVQTVSVQGKAHASYPREFRILQKMSISHHPEIDQTTRSRPEGIPVVIQGTLSWQAVAGGVARQVQNISLDLQVKVLPYER